MGVKHRRNRPTPQPVVDDTTKGFPWLVIVIGAAVVAGGGLLMMRSSSNDAAPVESTQAIDQSNPAPITTTNNEGASPAATVPAGTSFTSEELEDLPIPPLPYMAQTAGPPELMRQAYIFAAKNPDVLDYVPCYCGCGQTDGHVGNTDCFVESRAPNGQVLEWASHGMT